MKAESSKLRKWKTMWWIVNNEMIYLYCFFSYSSIGCIIDRFNICIFTMYIFWFIELMNSIQWVYWKQGQCIAYNKKIYILENVQFVIAHNQNIRKVLNFSESKVHKRQILKSKQILGPFMNFNFFFNF